MNLFEKLISKICPDLTSREKKMREQIKSLEEQLKKQDIYLRKIEHVLDNTVKIRTELHNTCLDVKKVRIELHDTCQDVKKIKQDLYDAHSKLNRENNEILWAHIFNNTINGSSWLKDKTFSLGRWAIGYPCAYVLYRVLNELHPRNILELGLGQSTRFTSQYAESHEMAEHLVVEHDPEWIKFFSRNYSIPSVTQIIHCPWKYGKYKETEGIREFDGFDVAIGEKRFDLIIIDAPFGGDMKEYARIDVLRKLPGCLSNSFIIIFDDCNRSGENHTFDEMLRVLDENNVLYNTGAYYGDKIVKIICSPDYGFVTSM